MGAKSFRTVIGIFGRTNAGKSSLINALTNQDVAIVSSMAGTTTDPVSKSMELLPLGPVKIVDTPGLGDVSELGEKRIEKTYDVLKEVDLAILVVDATAGFGEEEETFLKEIKSLKPVICVINKSDLKRWEDEEIREISKRTGVPVIRVSAKTKEGLVALKREIVARARTEMERGIIADLCKGGEVVLFVFPEKIDFPKGKLPLRWIKAFREVIDQDAYCVVSRRDTLTNTLSYINRKISLAVVDTKAYGNDVKMLLDSELIPKTSFSVLEARYIDLAEFVKGIVCMEKISKAKKEKKAYIVHACRSKRNPDDYFSNFVREKLEELKWDVELREMEDQFNEDCDLFVLCNACNLRRRDAIEFVKRCREKGKAITTIGLLAMHFLGYLKEFLELFPLEKSILEGCTLKSVPYELLESHYSHTIPANVWNY